MQVSLDLFSPDNIPLETEENKEIQAYQKITGGMSVEFEGKTQTMQQMSTYMEKTDRALRERAWRAMWERRLKDKEALDIAFDNLSARKSPRTPTAKTLLTISSWRSIALITLQPTAKTSTKASRNWCSPC